MSDVARASLAECNTLSVHEEREQDHQSASAGTVFVHLTTFNGEQWIDTAIQSILAQTYSDLVLNISDNASTDRTRHRIEEWAKKDSRIRYSIQETNRGAYFNWMLGLEQVERCPYFMWACQDDFWADDWLEQCLRELNSHAGVAACGRIVPVDLSGAAIDHYTPLLRRHRYMGSRLRWVRLARYALDLEELGKSGRILSVFRASELRRVDLWPKESPDVPIRAGDLLIVRRILAVGPIRTFETSTMYKRVGSTTLDFDPDAATVADAPATRWSRSTEFVRRAVAYHVLWYRLYASDSIRLHPYERVLLVLKVVRIFRRSVIAFIRTRLRRQVGTTG